jgi:hypothetical protein
MALDLVPLIRRTTPINVKNRILRRIIRNQSLRVRMTSRTILIAYMHGIPRTMPMAFFLTSARYVSTQERYTIDPNIAVHSEQESKNRCGGVFEESETIHELVIKEVKNGAESDEQSDEPYNIFILIDVIDQIVFCDVGLH